MGFRRISFEDGEWVVELLDRNTLVLRWLVAFFMHQKELPEGEEPFWSLWRDEQYCVAAHFFQNATTYVCAVEGADWRALGDLVRNEFLPEHVMGDKTCLQRWQRAAPEFFKRAGKLEGVDVMASQDATGAPAVEVKGFRAAGMGDLKALEEHAELLSREMGVEVLRDFESLIERELIFVAEEDGGVAGSIRSNLSDGRYVHAGGLFVHPRFRGRGVGRRLARGLAGWVRGKEGVPVILDVNASNQAAVGAYRAAGFRKVGEAFDASFLEDAWHGGAGRSGVE